MSLDFTNSENAFDLMSGEEREPFWVLTTNPRLASAAIIGCSCLITALTILSYKMTNAFRIQASHTETMNESYRNVSTRLLQSMEARVTEQVFDPRTQAQLIADTSLFAQQHFPDAPLSEVLKQAPALPTENLHDVTLKLLSSSIGQNYRHVNFRVEDPATRRFVDKLKRQDFEVFLGQSRLSAVVVQESEITNEPRAIAILQDKSGSTAGDADKDATAAVCNFIQSYANPVKVRLWTFSDTVTPLTPWTYDKDLLLASCVAKEPNGGTSLYDSELTVIDDLSKRPEIRTLVVVTDGTDTTKRDLLPTVIQRCKASNIAVYAIGLKSGALNEPTLKLLAAETGGKYYLAEKTQDLTPRLRDIARSIFSPAYRLIALVPSNSEESLRIQIGDSKLIVPHSQR